MKINVLIINSISNVPAINLRLKASRIKLQLDDSQDIVIARTYDEGLKAIQSNLKFDILFIDHDLGGEQTGAMILNWLQGNPQQIPRTVFITSRNQSGKADMMVIAKGLKKARFIEELYTI